MVLRVRRTLDEEVAVLIVRAASHQLCQVTAAGVAGMFRLSLMQSKLAVALVNGDSVEEFSRAARITHRTGKHHLGRLLVKFDCKTRLELVRKLCILVT
jgi:DNA-binding CsgD family transcriptional regulator